MYPVKKENVLIKIHNDDKIRIVLSGRLDSLNADEAKEKVDQALKDLDRDVVIDVSHLEYISSAGLQVVLRCAKAAAQHGRECSLKGARGTVHEIFQVAGFLTFLKEEQ